MHIAKNCIHYSSLENLDFLKQYDYYLQQWNYSFNLYISTMNFKRIKNIYFFVQMWEKKIQDLSQNQQTFTQYNLSS
jgi:hypothetical protein